MNDRFISNERTLVALNSEGKDNEEESAEKIIECIRREEFGLRSDISATKKSSILKKQHSRLGEALHRLSQELYSQDTNFLLELVRNADENMYPCDVEPTLTFVLQETGVIVLNNDQGFSVETIKALCKVGNSSKTEPSTRYISKKGISFKSAFQEVDAHSPWNQWLLMEFPKLFVNAELSICSLTCFKENPAKGISVFMSFVPLEGEVHGFFSQLPHMIIYKLCSSSCLLLQGEDNEWVTPCKVLRNWTEETRLLLPDSLIREHLDVGYLHKDTLLTDSLARGLGIEECGPEVLIQVMASLYQADSLKSTGLVWLSSWLNVLFLMLVNATECCWIMEVGCAHIRLEVCEPIGGTHGKHLECVSISRTLSNVNQKDKNELDKNSMVILRGKPAKRGI
ncbi:histidine kinase-, DNA gyrase B-, and HSP90-like ATPase family protein [Tanacetum coccineum]